MRPIILFTAAVSILATSCEQAAPNLANQEAPSQQIAGAPLNQVRTAGRIAAFQAASLVGDEAEAQRQFNAMHQDIRRSMKIPDSTRPIPREAARSATKAISGVRSVAWIDQYNLMVRVDAPEYRSQTMINAICGELSSLGDTLGTVINIQDASAQTGQGIATLSRDCQLQEGDRAFLQQARNIDVVDPAIRAQHRANQQKAELSRAQPTHGDQDALNAIPEI